MIQASFLAYDDHIAAFTASESEFERAVPVGRVVVSVCKITLQAVVRGLPDCRQHVGEMLRRYPRRSALHGRG